MNDDANARERLYRALENVFGLDVASQLMSSLPPHDWSQLATKDDLQAVQFATQRDIADLREASRHELSEAVLRLEARIADQSVAFERALRTELSKQSRAAVAGMVGMVMTIGLFVLGLLTILGV